MRKESLMDEFTKNLLVETKELADDLDDPELVAELIELCATIMPMDFAIGFIHGDFDIEALEYCMLYHYPWKVPIQECVRWMNNA